MLKVFQLFLHTSVERAYHIYCESKKYDILLTFSTTFQMWGFRKIFKIKKYLNKKLELGGYI